MAPAPARPQSNEPAGRSGTRGPEAWNLESLQPGGDLGPETPQPQSQDARMASCWHPSTPEMLLPQQQSRDPKPPKPPKKTVGWSFQAGKDHRQEVSGTAWLRRAAGKLREKGSEFCEVLGGFRAWLSSSWAEGFFSGFLLGDLIEVVITKKPDCLLPDPHCW